VKHIKEYHCQKEHRRRVSEGQREKVLSEEHKRKISETQTGKRHIRRIPQEDECVTKTKTNQ
jgi:hypothetical protein